jgi:hypothetical protein
MLSWIRLEFIGLVAGAIVTVTGIWVLRRTRRFERAAWRAPAVVTKVRQHWREDINEVYFHPVLRFVLADGRVIHTESDVGSSPSPVRAGDRVTCCTTRPTRPGARVASTIVTATIICVLMISIGGGFLLVSVVWTALEVWLKLR